MAKLKSVVDDVTTVAEGQRELYEKGDDGRYYLDLDEVDAHPSVRNLKSAFERVKKEEKGLRERYGKLPADLDIDKILELAEKAKTEDERKALEAGKFEDLKKQLADRQKEELAARDKQAARLTAIIRKIAAEDALKTAIREVGGNAKALTPMLLPRILVEIPEGDSAEVVVKVLDENGNVQLGDSSGNPKTLKQLVLEQKADPELAGLFTGTNTDGGGAPPKGTRSDSPESGEKRTLADFKTDTEKSEYIQKHGLDKYLEIVSATATQPKAPPAPLAAR